jgi:hypothetical protein
MIKIGRKIKSTHPPDELAGPEMNSSGPADFSSPEPVNPQLYGFETERVLRF